MTRCKFCGQEIDWITSLEGKPVPVDPDPVFVIEDDGPDTFLDDMGATVTGRQATPAEECWDLPVAFVPHRRTCLWADKPVQRRGGVQHRRRWPGTGDMKGDQHGTDRNKGPKGGFSGGV